MEEKGNTQAVIDAIERLKEPKPELLLLERGDLNKAPFVMLPKGRELVNVEPLLEQLREFPKRRKGVAQLFSIDSFIEHVNRFKDEQSAVFLDDSDVANPKLTAVYDYHQATGQGTARHGEHRAIYAFPMSDEWRAWLSAQKDMSQTTFAQLLEDRVLDVLSPAVASETVKRFGQELGIDLASPQKMMELSRGLAVRVNQHVEKVVNLSTGEGQVNFKEQHNGEDGAPLKVPGGFAIAISVFRNGPRYQVPVRLRYRVQQGAVVWTLALYRTDLIFQDATEEACNQVAEKTALPVFRGKPEA